MGRAAVGSVRGACSVGRRVRSIRAAALRAGGTIWTVGTALLLFEQGKMSEKRERSFRNFSISSEFFSCPMSGLTLSGKSGFCER